MFVEFGTWLVGMLSHAIDVEVKELEKAVDDGLADTETHTVQGRSKSPINTYLLMVG